VKLDVEGFELEALRGGASLFGRTDVFLIEVALYRFVDRPLLHDIVAYMASKGYFVYEIAGFIRRPYDGAVGLMDLCFAPHPSRPRDGMARDDNSQVMASGCRGTDRFTGTANRTHAALTAPQITLECGITLTAVTVCLERQQ
jgi:Methyltransferase FkbM domain